jgi:hypothetical protein
MFEGGLNTPCFKRFEELGFKIVPKIKANPNFMQINHRLTSACSAKPFTILAGGTGTGKTNSARMTAASIAGMDNVETVAVGADWTDNRALLGFRNLLAEGGKTYVAPPALRIILKALANPGKPYFLILDEMNLSRPEQYFAEFLSALEKNDSKVTWISKEYSMKYKRGDIPYYPINDEKNNKVYSQYKELSNQYPNIIFGGRLSEYKYYDMHQIIGSALTKVKKELNQ